MSIETTTTATTTETTEARYVPTGRKAHYAQVLNDHGSVGDGGALVFDEGIDAKLLEGGPVTLEQFVSSQEVAADISAALLHVASNKTIEFLQNNRDVPRVAGKLRIGKNEIAYSMQPMLGETNADGSAKNPVVSVIHRQYEAEDYRTIRNDVMVRAQSLRD